ncbi:hypothetical protein ACWEIK_21990 [Streptomyces sp. NPDC004673]
MTVSSPQRANRDLASSLREDLARLGRLCYFSTPILSASKRAKIESIVAPWRRLAQKYQHAARGSTSSHARWDALLDAARKPEHDLAPADPLTLYSGAQELLRALHEAQRPGPTVRQLTTRIRRSITTGTYPPGSVHNVRDLAREVGLLDRSFIRIELALLDLETEGLVTVDARKRFRVGKHTTDKAMYVTDLLRVLIEGGVFAQPPALLPSASNLARSLIASYAEVRTALGKLADDRLVDLGNTRRPSLRADHPLVAKNPPTLPDLAAQLRAHAAGTSRPTDDDVRQICRQVRNWWRMRSTPLKPELDQAVASLCSATEWLMQRAAMAHLAASDDISHLRWTAIIATATPPDDLAAQAWRAACLSAAVLRLLDMTKEGYPAPFEHHSHSSVPPSPVVRIPPDSPSLPADRKHQLVRSRTNHEESERSTVDHDRRESP